MEFFQNIEYKERLQSRADLISIKNYPLHMHRRDLQLMYVIEGRVRLKVAHGQYYVDSGNVHIIHPQDVHSIQAISDDNLILMVSIRTTEYERIFPNLNNLVFTANVTDEDESEGHAYKQELISAMLSLAAQQHRQDPADPALMKEKDVRLLTLLTTHFRGFSINPRHDYEYKTTYDLMQINRISNVICYIYENYASKLSLAEIADHEHISLHYLSHLFQKFVGVSFRDFIGLARVEMTESELLTTDHSIARISQNAGFSNAQYYSKNFHYWYGMHPKDYRRRYADQTLDYMEPEYEALPLERLEALITDNRLALYFTDRSDHYQLIELDRASISEEEGQKLPELSIQISADILWNDFSEMMEVPEETIVSLYPDSAEQKDCIDLLKGIAENHTVRLQDFNYIDRIDQPHGLLTLNGLEKPLCHLIRILRNSSSEIIGSGKGYFLLRHGEGGSVVLFNPRERGTLQTDILLRGFGDRLQITEQRLAAAKTCMKYWGQLQFPDQIREADRRNINRMTQPEVTYRILTGSDPKEYSCMLDPLDIAVIEIVH